MRIRLRIFCAGYIAGPLFDIVIIVNLLHRSVFIFFEGLLIVDVMKRKRSALTLWNAASVPGFGSMDEWWLDYSMSKNTVARADLGITSATTIEDVSDLLPAKHNKSTDDYADSPMTTFTVGIRPNSDQKRLLNAVLRVSNAAYNWTRWLVVEKGLKPQQPVLQKVVAKKKMAAVDPDLLMPGCEWLFEPAYASLNTIRLTACRKFIDHYWTAIKRNAKQFREKNVVDPPEGSFCVQKLFCKVWPGARSTSKNWCFFSMLSRYFKSAGQFMTLGKPQDKLPPIDHDLTVTRKPNGRFVLRIPCAATYTRVKSVEPSPKAICGVDPGDRAFLTVYDPSRLQVYRTGLIRDKDILMRPIYRKIDENQRLLTIASETGKHAEVRGRSRRARKLWRGLRDKMDNAHAKMAGHLVGAYGLVAIGDLSSSTEIWRRRRLNRRTKRSWNHYRFRRRLLHRAAGTGCRVIVQDEAYTSKTCGQCKLINDNLGSKEIFECASCNYVAHRDANGARNILMKAIGLL